MEDTGMTAFQPGQPWQPAPPPERRRPRWGVWVTVLVVVLALGCLGGVTVIGMRALGNTEAAAKGLAGAPARPGASAPAGETEPDAVTGPRPSSYPVRAAEDLQRVCEGWYYPTAPKVKSSGTQPARIFTRESKDFDTRTETTLYDIPRWYTAQKQKAWDPKSPAKVRLVGCVDLASSGKKVRTCKFDDPKGLKVPMREGTYRVALYEVATGRKVVDKRLKGEAEECPFLVLLGADRTIYSQVEGRRLYELFRKYVEK